MSFRQAVEMVKSAPARGADRPTVIFDFDGTLADTLSAIIGIVNDHADEFHILPLNDRDVEGLRGLSNLDILRKYRIPLTRLPGLLLRSQKELHDRMHEVKLFPGIRDLVLALKAEGVQMGILTSNSRENVHKLLRQSDLDVFDFIHSESNFFGKNRALNHLMRTRGLKPGKVVYVGDETRDIEACRRAMIPVISVSWGFHRPDLLSTLLPDYLIDTPGEILAIVLG